MYNILWRGWNKNIEKVGNFFCLFSFFTLPLPRFRKYNNGYYQTFYQASQCSYSDAFHPTIRGALFL